MQPTLKECGIILYFIEKRVLIYVIYLEFFCILSHSPLFSYLFLLGWNHGYLLFPLGYGPILYFVAKIVLSLAIGSSFSWHLSF